jgi:hypothetical protein
MSQIERKFLMFGCQFAVMVIDLLPKADRIFVSIRFLALERVAA